jgi:hypothetical protein
VIAAIGAHELNPTTNLTVLGSWVSPRDPKWGNATRTSDFMMGHFRAYGAATSDRRWRKVLDAHYALVATMQAGFGPRTGLLPDFVVNAPAAPRPAPPDFLEGARDGAYGANACRVPLRLGIDFLVSGDARARAALAPINAWVRRSTGDDPRKIDDGYHLDGTNFTPELRNRIASVAPFGVSAMSDRRNQVWLDRVWSHVMDRPLAEENYFGNTLKMISLIVMSGNWWSP